MKNTPVILGLLFLLSAGLLAQGKEQATNEQFDLQKVKSYDMEPFIVNQMKCDIKNWRTGGGFSPSRGIYWPGGVNADKILVTFDALYFSCLNNDSLIITPRYGSYYLPGKILDTGTPDDPDKEKYRIYKLKKGWESMVAGPERDQFEKDYNEWPVDDGAPWEDRDGDGIFTRGVDIPEYMGDETWWFVMNDITLYPEVYTFPSTPTLLGLEIQVTVFGFDRSDDLGDVVFKQYKIINKSGTVFHDFYLGYFGDLQIGHDNDDRCGTDTTFDMVYAYNATNFDDVFGYNPPAVGTMLLRGPLIPSSTADSGYINNRWIKGFKNNRMESTVCTFRNSDGDPSYNHYHFREVDFFKNPQEGNYILQGKLYNGLPMLDPYTGQITKFCLPGDPVNHSGWYYDEAGWPGLDTIAFPYDDVRMTATYGHFNMAPYDTQEIVIATIGARGSSNLNSITELKRKAAAVKFLFNHNFKTVELGQNPSATAYPGDGKVTLWWKENSENYAEVNPLLRGLGYGDSLYRFQGYIIKQYRDEKKTDPRTLQVYDLQDSISVVRDYIIVNGEKFYAPVINGSNEGLHRYINITTDAYTGEPLRNADTYYYSVDAYAVNLFSVPSFIESDSPVITVMPGINKIDFSSPYENGGGIFAQQTEGMSNADVFFKVIDPSSIRGDSYEVSFYGEYDSLNYALINITAGDTIFTEVSDFTADSINTRIFDGMMILLNDRGRAKIDSLSAVLRPFGVAKVIETRGPGGLPLDNPINVYDNLNSTGKWKLTTLGHEMQNIDVYNYINAYDYEIRFTQGGSEYYPYGNPAYNNIFAQNEKAADRVPFELWNITKGRRLNVKIQDIGVKDNIWSKDTSKNQWERFYAYDTGTGYAEPLPSVCDSSGKNNYPFGYITIEGELPEAGTVIRIETLKPLVDGDKYIATPEKADFNNTESAKDKIDKISVFPNPYFGGSDLERTMGERIIRFTGLPKEVTIRIYTLAGVFVRRLDKSDLSQYIDWDLKNENGSLVASGVYIANLDMPGIGTKIMKLAVVIGKEFLNRE